jgi:hypothetical protein
VVLTSWCAYRSLSSVLAVFLSSGSFGSFGNGRWWRCALLPDSQPPSGLAYRWWWIQCTEATWLQRRHRRRRRWLFLEWHHIVCPAGAKHGPWPCPTWPTPSQHEYSQRPRPPWSSWHTRYMYSYSLGQYCNEGHTRQ